MDRKGKNSTLEAVVKIQVGLSSRSEEKQVYVIFNSAKTRNQFHLKIFSRNDF